MFCPDCGSEVAEGRRFCGKCGGQLRAAPGSVEAVRDIPESPVEAVVPVPRAPLSTRKKLTYALVALLVVLGGVGWWWFHRPAPAYKVQDPGIYPFQGLTADGKAQKWGFIDADGKVLFQPKWDAVAEFYVSSQSVAFSEGLCGVQKDGKWGFIDTGGNLVIPNQFDSAGPFIEGLAKVTLGNLAGFIDKTGQYAINPQFNEALNFSGGLAAVRADAGWGFINRAGAYVIKPSYQFTDNQGFSGDLAFVCINGKCGYIGRNGAFVIKPQFTVTISSGSTFSEGMASVVINGKWGYIDESGRIVINPQFDYASQFSGGLALVYLSGEPGPLRPGMQVKFGIINKKGKYVVNPGQYKGLSECGSNCVVASTDDGMGLITKDGKWVLKPSKALTETAHFFGKVFDGKINGQITPISISGKVLAGPYRGAMLDTLAQDIDNENSAQSSVHSLIMTENSYNFSNPAKGFTSDLAALGKIEGSAGLNGADQIDAALATGTKDGYQFTITIPAGTSTGGTNFNYFLVAKPSAAGHAGRSFCADSSGAVRYAVQGEECTVTSPTL
jgi:hypothetical protein